MSKLESSGEITRKTTNKYQVVRLLKWEKLQGNLKDDNKQNNIEITDNQQSNNNQITTTKEYKEIKKDIFSEERFLSVWAEAREYWDKAPTNISKLSFNESLSFKELIKTYTEKEFREALNGLFFQGTLPQLRVRPTWFLKIENFESMRECWLSKNKMYGDQKLAQ